MFYVHSQAIRTDAQTAVLEAAARHSIVNLSLIARGVWMRNAAENVAIEDIEALVLEFAKRLNVAVEFDGSAAPFLESVDLPDGVPGRPDDLKAAPSITWRPRSGTDRA